MLTRETLQAQIDGRFATEPQKHAVCRRRADEMFDCLGELSAYGVVLAVDAAEPVVDGHPAYQAFPMWVTFGEAGKTVEDEEELRMAEEEGWSAPEHYRVPPRAAPAAAVHVEE